MSETSRRLFNLLRLTLRAQPRSPISTSLTERMDTLPLANHLEGVPKLFAMGSPAGFYAATSGVL